MDIRSVAVLGSGVMGSGIAALIANAGLKVALLDIVPPGATDRNELAKKGIARQLASGGFTHPDYANNMLVGNVEDDNGILAQADWIIEAVIEKIEIKQQVYKKIDAVRKAGSVVSSNTSTLPLHALVEGMSEEFARDFIITHFFIPPRHMRLLEIVTGPHTRPGLQDAFSKIADACLGKEVVICKDTPGFIANRIGIYWMVVALLEAERLGISVEQADALMGRPIGLPKTGVFGLYDLIGLDLIPLIAQAMLANVPPEDDFRATYRQPDWLKKMIADGYTGRKGKGGFYRVRKDGEKKIREVLDLQSMEYRAEIPATLASATARTIKELLAAGDVGSEYAWNVLSRTMVYAASLIPEISDTIAPVDAAMKEGYSWQHGVFALLDQIGVAEFSARLEKEGRAVPALLANAKSKPMYKEEGKNRMAMALSGNYQPVLRPEGQLWVADMKRGATPVASNASASLWDIGDGIACLELTSKLNAIDADILTLIEQIIPRLEKEFRGLVIANDTEFLSAGANLSVFLGHAEKEEWQAVSDIIRRGQRVYMALKYAPFPVVSALAGTALGGGCELVMHSLAVQVHAEAHPGLVEVNVGLIPAWGGCKEMLLRHNDGVKAFEYIIGAKVAGSAEEARDMGIVPRSALMTMNRARMLADAKRRCMELAESYAAPEPVMIRTQGAAAKNAILQLLDALYQEGKESPHEVVIGRVLAHVLSGGETSGDVSEQHMLDLEHEGFMELIRTAPSQARIAHMLKTGKPLHN